MTKYENMIKKKSDIHGAMLRCSCEKMKDIWQRKINALVEKIGKMTLREVNEDVGKL